MAATFIPVSTLTVFGVERDTIYIPSLKTLVSTLFFQASLESVIASSTFRHTTGVDTATTLKVSISAVLDTLIGAHNKSGSKQRRFERISVGSNAWLNVPLIEN